MSSRHTYSTTFVVDTDTSREDIANRAYMIVDRYFGTAAPLVDVSIEVTDRVGLRDVDAPLGDTVLQRHVNVYAEDRRDE